MFITILTSISRVEDWTQGTVVVGTKPEMRHASQITSAIHPTACKNLKQLPPLDDYRERKCRYALRLSMLCYIQAIRLYIKKGPSLSLNHYQTYVESLREQDIALQDEAFDVARYGG